MCPQWFRDLHKDRKDIVFTGELKRQKDYIKEMSSFTLGSCCVDSGCGMNVKVSNYCALGLPVVLTPICHTGYECIDSLILAELNPEDIASKIVKILSDANYAAFLGEKNCRLLYKHLAWNKVVPSLEQALDYAYTSSHKTTTSKEHRVQPIWLLEKRHDTDVIQGHFIIKK